MKTLSIIFCFCCTIHISMNAQNDDLPYYEIPEYPENYTAETVAARMIDGLGFRYYWGTEGLRKEDLDYQPHETSRTSYETLQHLLGLSRTIINGVNNTPNVRRERENLSYEEMRRQTLENLKSASDILRNAGEGKLNESKIIFQRGDQKSEYPFWNLINGPIADALWHTGQVVAFRRASGNPFNSNASVFSGKLRK